MNQPDSSIEATDCKDTLATLLTRPNKRSIISLQSSLGLTPRGRAQLFSYETYRKAPCGKCPDKQGFAQLFG